MAWAEEHFEELAAEHPDKYIAVLDQKVVDSDVNYEALTQRIERAFPLAHPTVLSLPSEEREGEKHV